MTIASIVCPGGRPLLLTVQFIGSLGVLAGVFDHHRWSPRSARNIEKKNAILSSDLYSSRTVDIIRRHRIRDPGRSRVDKAGPVAARQPKRRPRSESSEVPDPRRQKEGLVDCRPVLLFSYYGVPCGLSLDRRPHVQLFSFALLIAARSPVSCDIPVAHRNQRAG